MVEGMLSALTAVLSGVPYSSLFISMTSTRVYQKVPKLDCSLMTPFYIESLKNQATQPPFRMISTPFNFGNKNGKWNYTLVNARPNRPSNKIFPITNVYKIHNTPIFEVNSAKYLGVLIDTNLNWRSHYTHVIKKCSSTLAFIKRNLSKSPTVTTQSSETCHPSNKSR